MAGGPYKNKGSKWYYIKWSNNNAHPREPKKTESLKTSKKKIANLRKGKLENLYMEGKHDPWIKKWYDNEAIKPLIVGHLFDNDVDINSIKPPKENFTPSFLEAIKIYINYKEPEGKQKTEKHQWNPQTNAPKMKSELLGFASIVGPQKKVRNITQDDYKKIIKAKNLNSDHSIAGVARIWNAFINYATDKMGWIITAPKVEIPKPQANIPVFLYNDYLYKICQYKYKKVQQGINTGFTQPDNSQLYMPLAWILIRYTGMRPIELQKLYLDAIDLVHRQIIVGKRFSKNTNRTKTALQRKIDMNEIVYQICKLVKNPEIREKDRWMKRSDHIFGRSGNMSKKRLSREFTEARKEVLPRRDEITLYTLRHTFAVSRLTDPNTDENPLFAMKNIRDDMGHEDIATTEKYWKAVPNRFHQQRLHNSKLFCKIIQKFHESSMRK